MNWVLAVFFLYFITKFDNGEAVVCHFCEDYKHCDNMTRTIKCYFPTDGCLTVISNKGVYKRNCSPYERRYDPCKGEKMNVSWILCYHCTDELCNKHVANSTATNYFQKMPSNATYFGIFGLIFLMTLLLFE